MLGNGRGPSIVTAKKIHRCLFAIHFSGPCGERPKPWVRTTKPISRLIPATATPPKTVAKLAEQGFAVAVRWTWRATGESNRVEFFANPILLWLFGRRPRFLGHRRPTWPLRLTEQGSRRDRPVSGSKARWNDSGVHSRPARRPALSMIENPIPAGPKRQTGCPMRRIASIVPSNGKPART